MLNSYTTVQMASAEYNGYYPVNQMSNQHTGVSPEGVIISWVVVGFSGFVLGVILTASVLTLL